MFNLTITISESLLNILPADFYEPSSKKKRIRKLVSFFGNTVSTIGDMTKEQVISILDDLPTDGKQIYSDKIKKFGNKILHLHQFDGDEIPIYVLNGLNGW